MPPKGTWVGQGWGNGTEWLGTTLHKESAVLQPLLWENEHHEVFVFDNLISQRPSN